MQAIIDYIYTQFGVHISLRDVLLFGMTPIFMLGFAVECFYLKRLKVFEKFIDVKESIVNFLLAGSYQASELVINLLFLSFFLKWFEQFQFFHIPVDGIFIAIVLFVLQEFCYYWYHRSSHRMRWFWCAHVVHHSSENMNLSVAMRQSLMYPVSGNFLFFLPLVLIGFSAEAVFASYAVNLMYQFFIHTQQIPKLHPILEYIFDTPSNHRAHHGRNPEYIDKNFGGVLIIFDRMFGTYVEEDEVNNPIDYGIPQQIQSLNLIEINFHEWRDMIKDILKPGKFSERLKHLWKPPEWKRDSETELAAQQ